MFLTCVSRGGSSVWREYLVHTLRSNRYLLWAHTLFSPKQIKKAYCPPEVVEANPILDYSKHILFAWFGEVREGGYRGKRGWCGNVGCGVRACVLV